MSRVARTIVLSTVKVHNARSCIMTIPHSSTVCERVLSTVRKKEKKTDQRASPQWYTLEALLVVKAKPGSFLDGDGQHSDTSLRN